MMMRNDEDQKIKAILESNEFSEDALLWNSRTGANFLIDVFSLHKDLGTAMDLSEVLSDFMMKHGGYIMQAVDFRCGREEK